MRLICSDQQFVSYFSSDNSLLDGKIERIEIFDKDSSVCIIIDFEMRPSADYEKVQLRFVGCKGYSFSYSDQYYFYNVELVKLFRNEDGLFYISFDPSDEVEVISDEDQDFILCSEVSAYCD